MIKKKISQEELDENEEITKNYELRLKLNTKKKMKIKYNNPDDIDKVFEIQSTDDDVLQNGKNVVPSQEWKDCGWEAKQSKMLRVTLKD